MQAPFQSAVQPRWEEEGMEPVTLLPDSRLTHSSLKIHASLFCLTSNMPGLKLTAHWCHLIMLSSLSLFPNEELRWDAGEHLTSSVHLTVWQFTQLKKFQDLKDWRLDSCYRKEPLAICFFFLISETLFHFWTIITVVLAMKRRCVCDILSGSGEVADTCRSHCDQMRSNCPDKPPYCVEKLLLFISRKICKSCRWLLSRRRKKYEELRQQHCLRRFWRDCWEMQKGGC